MQFLVMTETGPWNVDFVIGKSAESAPVSRCEHRDARRTARLTFMGFGQHALTSAAAITIALCAPLLFLTNVGGAEAQELRDVGVARIDITPSYPIRLTGYAVRKKESEGVSQRLWAKALAVGSDREKPALLITVDNCGVPVGVRDEVVRGLQKSRGIAPERIAICSSHTHCAPMVKGFAPNIFEIGRASC